MDEMMNFPDDWHDFIKSNSFVDSEKIYTNGALLMTELRVEQLVEHILREKEQQWISVKDRLPTERINENTYDFDWVLCATTFGDVRAYKFGTPPSFKKPHFWDGPGMMDKYVTHWMSLPELPKEMERK